MKLSDYIKDKAFTIFISSIVLITIEIIMLLLHSHIVLIVFTPFLLILGFIFCLIHDYSKKNIFYKQFSKMMNDLDKKYLITEIIKYGDFVEGNYLIDYLYEIDKSYHEEINKYKFSIEEFKEYLELWCHEIKTPIATGKLILENKKTADISEELEKIEDYVEQILYYSRSEVVEKDYFINKVNLKDIVNDVIKRNKKDILNKGIKITPLKDNVIVNSDQKWLEYIINQVITNSIKYSKEHNSLIKFTYKINPNNVFLMIEDNGLGIKTEDIEKVFEKGFTGTNGRNMHSSTGMGLYLVNKLCQKLGHDIHISSKEDEYTIVTIVFPIGSMTK